MLSPFATLSQTRRRSAPKRPPSTSYAEKQAAEVRAGRERIAGQIKTLAQFLYLFAGISKGIETAEQANRNNEESSLVMPIEQVERNKAKVRDSIRSLRSGLEQLESSFRVNPALTGFYPNLAGIALLGQTAETQAAANDFNQAGKTLISAVNKLADALVLIR
jgi:hypothetical protein